MPVDINPGVLKRLFKYCVLLMLAAVAYVLFDFAIDIRPPQIHASYRFNIGELTKDRARILRQDNLSILVIRRSPDTIEALRQVIGNLQDPESRNSRQPEFAENLLRSRHPEYFVSYAIGTDFGCVIETIESGFKEICGNARYDFAGRALKGDNKFHNLAIPDYNFSNNFNVLTIRP